MSKKQAWISAFYRGFIGIQCLAMLGTIIGPKSDYIPWLFSKPPLTIILGLAGTNLWVLIAMTIAGASKNNSRVLTSISVLILSITVDVLKAYL